MSEKNVLTIVIDTNIWISFLIGKKLTSLKEAIIIGKVELCFSEELFVEFFDVVKRPNISRYFPEKAITELFALINDKIKIIKSDCVITNCRDAKDNFLLELAVSAKADYLVTSDNDLLTLNPYQGIRIVNPREFEDLLKGK